MKIFLLLFLTSIVYVFSFGNSFVWDDEQFILNNTLVHDLRYIPDYFHTNTIAGSGFMSNYYRPLTTLSFAIDYANWGTQPFGFLLTNTALHMLAGVLLFLVLQRIMRRFFSPSITQTWIERAAFVVALAFLIHPVQVEAVVYISGRGDSLSAVFGLFFLFAFFQLDSALTDNKRIIWNLIAWLSFVCAVLSKEGSVALLGIIVFFTILSFFQKKTVHKGITIAVFCTTALYFILRLTILNFQDVTNYWGETNEYTSSILVRIATFFFHVLPQYYAVLVYPYHLHMERDASIVTALNTIHPVDAAVSIGVLVFALFALFWIRKTKWILPALFGLVWFCVFLTPVSGIFAINGIVYEHWLYLPLVGAVLFLYSFFSSIVDSIHRISTQRISLSIMQKIARVLLLVLFSWWMIRSIQQILIWRSPITLYEHVLRYTETTRIRNNLGMAYAERKEYEKAIQQYERAIELNGLYPQTYHNLANVYMENPTPENIQKARTLYTKTLSLEPNFFFSINRLIQLETAAKQYGEAKKWAEYGNARFPDGMYEAMLLQIDRLERMSQLEQRD